MKALLGYTLALTTASGLLFACGGDAESTAVDEAESAMEDVIDEIDVPSEEEAEAAAEEAIDEANLDAEFEALKAEIEGDDG